MPSRRRSRPRPQPQPVRTSTSAPAATQPTNWQTWGLPIIAFLSALLLAIFSPLAANVGERLNKAIPGLKPTAPSPLAEPSPIASQSNSASSPCGRDGPPISWHLDEAEGGPPWWATEKMLPENFASTLNRSDAAPHELLKPYDPIKMTTMRGSLHRLILTGQCQRPVIIRGIHSIIVSRTAPISGSVVYMPPQGDIDTQAAVLNLDAPAGEQLLAYDAQTGDKGGQFFSQKITELKDGETYPIDIFGQTERNTVEWRIGIKLLVGSDEVSLELSMADGKALRTTAKATSYKSAFVVNVAKSKDAWEQVDGNRFWQVAVTRY